MSEKKVVITGGLGLLGRRILRHLLPPSGSVRPAGRAVDVLIIDKNPIDATDGKLSNTAFGCDSTTSTAVSTVQGELSSAETTAAIKEFLAGGSDVSSDQSVSIFHLASVMSGQGEMDFEEALRVNVEGTASLLQTCREIGGRPRFVFASSTAAFGGGANVSDETKLLPQTTYGMTKACAELLVNDCTRKGFVDGRIARLPTVIVRPGPPNTAATGCFSSIPKAVLHGHHFISPVSPDVPHPCVGVSTAVQGLICLNNASEIEMGNRDRAVTLPSLSLSLRDLEQAAAKLAREMGRSPGTVSYEPDEAVESVVAAFPLAVQVSERARHIGLRVDAGAREIIMEYAIT